MMSPPLEMPCCALQACKIKFAGNSTGEMIVAVHQAGRPSHKIIAMVVR